MKLIYLYSFFLFLFLGKTSQAQFIYSDTIKYITKNWMIKEVIDPGFADEEDEADFKEFIKTLRITFKTDGKLVFSNGGEKINGRWEYRRNTKEIRMIIPGEDPIILQIIIITESLLKFKNKTGGNGSVPSGTFVPAK